MSQTDLKTYKSDSYVQTVYAALCSNMSFQVATACWLVVHIAAEHRSLAAAHESWATLGKAIAFSYKTTCLVVSFQNALQLSFQVFCCTACRIRWAGLLQKKPWQWLLVSCSSTRQKPKPTRYCLYYFSTIVLTLFRNCTAPDNSKSQQQ
jgi:hypothetical protein